MKGQGNWYGRTSQLWIKVINIPCLVALGGWVTWGAWAWGLVSVFWGNETGGGAELSQVSAATLVSLPSGLSAACRTSQVTPRALGEAHFGEFLATGLGPVCSLPLGLSLPLSRQRGCMGDARGFGSVLHTCVWVCHVGAPHFLPTPSSSRKLEGSPCGPDPALGSWGHSPAKGPFITFG